MTITISAEDPRSIKAIRLHCELAKAQQKPKRGRLQVVKTEPEDAFWDRFAGE